MIKQLFLPLVQRLSLVGRIHLLEECSVRTETCNAIKAYTISEMGSKFVP